MCLSVRYPSCSLPASYCNRTQIAQCIRMTMIVNAGPYLQSQYYLDFVVTSTITTITIRMIIMMVMEVVSDGMVDGGG